MSSEAAAATPGVDRVVTVAINGHSFGFRRPSRADVHETRRRMAQRMVSDLHEVLDGASMEWECALEVGLQSQVRDGVEIKLGEHAPDHWFQPVVDSGGKPIGRVVAYGDVLNDEFRAVCDALGAELGKKKP